MAPQFQPQPPSYSLIIVGTLLVVFALTGIIVATVWFIGELL